MASPYGSLPAGFQYTPRAPRPGPGFVVDPRTGRWVRKSVATPGRTGSVDPSGALSSFTDLQRTYLDAVSRGPDYSGIAPAASEDALTGQAGRIATSRFQPGIDAVQAERGYQAARKKVSSEAALAFQNALTGILQGGNTNIDDPAGQKYALENFGGSYLGGMAALIGQQLLGQIENTFNERDFALANRLDELMTKYPAEAENIYADLVSGEQQRVKEGKSIADADYKTQLGALASAIKFERENRLDAAKGVTAGKPYVSYFTDPATGARMGVRPDGTPVPISGGKAAEPMTPSQVSSILSNADQIVTESVKYGATTKDAVLQARRYLRDNGVKNFGQWSPYTTPAGPDATKGALKTYKFSDGSVWKVKPDGSGMTRIKGPGNVGGGTSKDQPQSVQAKVRAQIRARRSTWATPIEADDASKIAALQKLRASKGISDQTRAKVLQAKYVADQRFLKKGRWVSVLPGGFTDDPKKARRETDYATIEAQAMELASDLYALGWSEPRVRSWVAAQLRGIGIGG